MKQDLENIETVLRTYLSRGMKACDALESDLVDEAIELLRKRRAAYYNYLALDYRLRVKYPDYEMMQQFVDLWDSIKVANGMLEETIDKKNISLGRELVSLRKSRAKLNKFKSVTGESRSFRSEA